MKTKLIILMFFILQGCSKGELNSSQSTEYTFNIPQKYWGKYELKNKQYYLQLKNHDVVVNGDSLGKTFYSPYYWTRNEEGYKKLNIIIYKQYQSIEYTKISLIIYDSTKIAQAARPQDTLYKLK